MLVRAISVCGTHAPCHFRDLELRIQRENLVRSRILDIIIKSGFNWISHTIPNPAPPRYDFELIDRTHRSDICDEHSVPKPTRQSVVPYRLLHSSRKYARYTNTSPARVARPRSEIKRQISSVPSTEEPPAGRGILHNWTRARAAN